MRGLDLRLYPGAPYGAQPSAEALSPNGKRLYVALAGINAVAVLDAQRTTRYRYGLIPTGWYPNALALSHNGRYLYVLDSKGVTGWGVLQRIDLKRTYLVRATLDALRYNRTPAVARFNPVIPPLRSAKRSETIDHVVYVAVGAGNYDDVFGDLKDTAGNPHGNGDSSLAVYPQSVTPNLHALAQAYALADNFYASDEDANVAKEVATAGEATLYQELVAAAGAAREPLNDRGDDPEDYARSGYLFNALARAGLSFRDYGGLMSLSGYDGLNYNLDVPALAALSGNVDLDYSGGNPKLTDVQRASEFVREMQRYVQNDAMPNFTYVSLPAERGANGCRRCRSRRGLDRRFYLAHSALELDGNFHRPRRNRRRLERSRQPVAYVRIGGFAAGQARLRRRYAFEHGEHPQDRRRDIRTSAVDVERSARNRFDEFLHRGAGARDVPSAVTTHNAIQFGPRLVSAPTGRLRAALMIRPSPQIETASPLIGEPGAIFERALEQHANLRRTLAYFGVKMTVADSHSGDPYEAAVSDAAVVFEDGAAMMRLSPLSRRAEVDRLQAEFSMLDVPVAGHIAAPGLFDGNDVLLAGNTAFVGVPSTDVGQATRGNQLGRSGFAALARARGYRVVEVRLAEGVPALRAVAGAAASDTIVVGMDKVDLAAFDGFHTIVLARGEEQAAGVLPLGERHVVAEMRYRTALSAMRRAGIMVEALDLYEFTKLGLTPSMLALALRRE